MFGLPGTDGGFMAAILSNNNDKKFKLKAPDITNFDGDDANWRKWKTNTKVVFIASGYASILTDQSYASSHPAENRIVYAKLSSATVEGTAHHVVAQFITQQDGYGSWTALLHWYDGDDVIADVAASLR